MASYVSRELALGVAQAPSYARYIVPDVGEIPGRRQLNIRPPWPVGEIIPARALRTRARNPCRLTIGCSCALASFSPLTYAAPGHLWADFPPS